VGFTITRSSHDVAMFASSVAWPKSTGRFAAKTRREVDYCKYAQIVGYNSRPFTFSLQLASDHVLYVLVSIALFPFQVAVRDDRFQAVNVLRFMGFLLHLRGFPCPELWDPEEPLKWLYGPYHKAMCMTAL
jgi:hypothetical protein